MIFEPHQSFFFRERCQDDAFFLVLPCAFQDFPVLYAGIAPLEGDILLLRIILDAHQEMIYRPVWLRLHAREIVERAVSLVEGVALAIEIHREKLADPFFIFVGNTCRIAEFSCIRMHQDIDLRHVAQMLLIELRDAAVVIADAPLHMVQRFDRDAVFIADVVHKIVIVVTSEVRTHHRIGQGIDLSDEIVIAIVHIDVFQPVAIRPQLPEGGVCHVLQVRRAKEFRILVIEFLRICHHDALEIQIFDDVVSEDRGIAPPIFEHQVQCLLRKRLAFFIVLLDVFLRDGHVAIVLQGLQVLAELLSPDQCRGVSDAVDTEVRKRDEARIGRGAHLTLGIGLVCLSMEKEGIEQVERRDDEGDLHQGPRPLHAVLMSGIRFLPQRHGFSPAFCSALWCFSISFFFFFSASRTSAGVMRVPQVSFQKVNHATGICQSRTAS